MTVQLHYPHLFKSTHTLNTMTSVGRFTLLPMHKITRQNETKQKTNKKSPENVTKNNATKIPIETFFPDLK